MYSQRIVRLADASAAQLSASANFRWRLPIRTICRSIICSARWSIYQKQDIAAIQQCVADLAGDPAGRALAEEVLGNARGHLESLEELLAAELNAKR